MKLLTKSRYLSGLQCSKLLWTLVNDKGSIPPLSDDTLARMEVGTEIGALATELFPGGISIPSSDFMGNINQTKEFLKTKKPLFEAGFMVDGIYVRVDILKPNEDGSYDIIEVKSSAKVKVENIQDVGFQRHCLELLGMKINKTFLCYINTEYVRDGDIDIHQLFTVEDITDRVVHDMTALDLRIKEMKEEMAEKTSPNVLIGSHCSKPYSCPLKETCWSYLPQNNVFDLYRGGKRSEELYLDDVESIKDIPDNFKLNNNQSIQKACAISNEPHVQPFEIQQFFDTLQYPIYHFDFETIASTIPQFDGMRPYQRLAFQYSLHIEQEDGSIEHKSFLADGKGDCRRDLIKSMREDLGEIGSILVYYEPFERGVIKELIRDFPEIEEWANSILVRIRDLHVPFKNFYYYNPCQKGSASIKDVLPALTDLSYKHLGIQNGLVASDLFAQTMFGDLSQEEIIKIRNDLEEYCKMDTWAEVLILRNLKKLV